MPTYDQAQDRVEGLQREIDSARRGIRVLQTEYFKNLCEQLDALPSWEAEVSYAYMYTGSDYIKIEIFANSQVEDPQLARDLVRHGICRKLDKCQSWDKKSINASGTVTNSEDSESGRVVITVMGYVPATCEVIIEEVEVPAKIEKRTRIVCDGEEVTK